MQWNFLWVEIGTICLILCGFYHNQDGSFCEILKKVCFGGFLWIRQKRPSVIKNHLRAWLLNTIPMYGWNIVQTGEVDLWQSWFEVCSWLNKSPKFKNGQLRFISSYVWNMSSYVWNEFQQWLNHVRSARRNFQSLSLRAAASGQLCLYRGQFRCKQIHSVQLFWNLIRKESKEKSSTFSKIPVAIKEWSEMLK